MNKPNNVINEPFGLASQDIDFFRENGFVKLAKVLPAEVLQFYGEEITAKVMQLNTMHLPMKERTTYKKAFLQIANIWKQSEIAKEFVFGTRLARIAAELMGTTGVRLYHDQALYKEPTGGATPWHVDQFYWPSPAKNVLLPGFHYKIPLWKWDHWPLLRKVRTIPLVAICPLATKAKRS